MDFEQLVKARHSAVNFIKEEKITEEDFQKIFELIKTTPSAYNLQPVDYLVITDEEKKEIVRELSYNQYKIHTASAVIIVMGNKKSVELDEAKRIYGPLKMLNVISELDFNTTMDTIDNYGTNLKKNEKDFLVELSRNVGIHASFFMLAAKHYGFDTCPMHVHNIEGLRKEFNIPEHLEPMLMITIGKSVDKIRPRGYRKPVGEFVQYNKY